MSQLRIWKVVDREFTSTLEPGQSVILTDDEGKKLLEIDIGDDASISVRAQGILVVEPQAPNKVMVRITKRDQL